MLRFLIAALFVSTSPALADSWVVCDNGLRCVMAPCPSYNALHVADGTVGRITGIDMMLLPERDRARLSPNIGSEEFVLDGKIERHELTRSGRRAAEIILVASKIGRVATERERDMCRR